MDEQLTCACGADRFARLEAWCSDRAAMAAAAVRVACLGCGATHRWSAAEKAWVAEAAKRKRARKGGAGA